MTGTRELRPLGDPLGTEAIGIDLSQPLDAETFAWIEGAFAEHPVLVFREQKLGPAELAAFGRRFGKPKIHSLVDYRHAEYPEVSWLTNVDKDGNIWITDGHAKDGKGFQVFKFSPEGKVLLTLGKAGVAGDGPDTFNEPNDVAIAPNGDIFVSDGHTPNMGNARVVKFTKDGKFIRQWGGHGSGPGQFEVPHALAFDSQGRLFVGDRANNRIQIFDQDGKFIAEWKQFGRPSGIYIDANDVVYVTDSESTDRQGYGHNPGYKRGIRIGSAKDGTVTAFIPDPSPGTGATSMSEGVAADAAGNVYGAEVGPKDLKKYIR